MYYRSIFRFLDFTSPPIIYSIIWLSLIFLYHLKIINYYQDLHSLTLVTLLATIFSYYFTWALIRLNNPIKRKITFEAFPTNFEFIFTKLITKSNKIWISGVTFTIIVQGGFPLLWMLIGSSKNYTDFGISSIHGFLTSFWLFSLLGYYILFLHIKNKSYLIKIILLFMFPIISINRGALMLGFIELLSAYLYYTKISFSKISKIILSLLCIIYIFGIIGDFRVNKKLDFMYSIVSEDYQELFVDKLPSGFTWGYLYYTASLDNVNGNISNLDPKFIPDKSVITLFPTVIRQFIWTDKNYDTKYVMKMTNPLINTFTYISGFLVDFGIIGTLFLLFLFNYL